jgi:hypothetical protein
MVNMLTTGTTITAKNRGQGGSLTAIAPDALTLTYAAPLGWTPPEGETRIPVFLSWGVVNSVIPDNIDAPVFYLPAIPADDTTYIAAKCTLTDVNSTAVSAATLLADTNLAHFDNPAFGSDGSAPAYCHVILGRIVSASGAIELQSTGKGSLLVSTTTVDFGCTGAEAAFSRQLVWWRSNN